MTSGQPLPQDREPSLTIAQVAERTGLTHDTLRYYEKAGLIERVGRTTGNQRRYEASDVAWLEHRAELADRIRALRRNAAALDDKIDHYERLLDERRPGTDEQT